MTNPPIKPVVMVIAGRADGPIEVETLNPDAGALIYLKAFDVNGGDNLYAGHVELTTDIGEAKRFKNLGEAFEEWRRQSRRRPLRPDGRPNRPLTAYHVTFTPAPEDS